MGQSRYCSRRGSQVWNSCFPMNLGTLNAEMGDLPVLSLSRCLPLVIWITHSHLGQDQRVVIHCHSCDVIQAQGPSCRKLGAACCLKDWLAVLMCRNHFFHVLPFCFVQSLQCVFFFPFKLCILPWILIVISVFPAGSVTAVLIVCNVLQLAARARIGRIQVSMKQCLQNLAHDFVHNYLAQAQRLPITALYTSWVNLGVFKVLYCIMNAACFWTLPLQESLYEFEVRFLKGKCRSWRDWPLQMCGSSWAVRG